MDNNIEQISGPLVLSLCRKLMQRCYHSCNYIDGNNWMKGIFSFLQNHYKTKNLEDSKIISFRESSRRGDSLPPIGVTGFNNEGYKRYWSGENIPNQWLQIDFIKDRISFNGIAIYTGGCDI